MESTSEGISIATMNMIPFSKVSHLIDPGPVLLVILWQQ